MSTCVPLPKPEPTMGDPSPTLTPSNDTPSPGGTRKRRRIIPVVKSAPYLEADSLEEQRQLHVALRLSMTQTKVEETKTLEAPIYRPSEEEFADPLAYIRKIAPEAEGFGICKVVPPSGWKAPCGLKPNDMEFETKLQRLQDLQEGKIFGDGNKYTFITYKKMADTFALKNYPDLVISRADSPAEKAKKFAAIEKEYWKIVQHQSSPVEVEYANDLNTDKYGSGFRRLHDDTRFQGDGMPGYVKPEFDSKKYYTNTGWNLNNLPFLEGSVLHYLRQKIEGITVPWLYCGMLFATFAWHNEDNYLYSMNYMHYGSSKTWYGVPGAHAVAFEKCMRDNLDQRFRENPTLLYDITTVLPPAVFQKRGIPVCSVVQEPGEFIITFPKAYHAGFSHGFNVAEAVNFALPEWIPHGRESIEHYKRRGRWSVLCHEQLILSIAKECNDLATCVLCEEEMRKIIQAEENDTLQLAAQGITNKFELSEFPEEIPECAWCKRSCAFLGVVKTTDEEMVVCPQHIFALDEPSTEKVWVLRWYDVPRLKADLKNLQDRIEKFSGRSTVKTEQ